MLSEQQQRIMGYFIEEAKDHLGTIEQGLLNLKPTLEDPEMANEIFRAAHSVKGGAAMLGLTSIQNTAHRLEDYFKVLKECALQIDQKLETMLLRVYDTLQELVEQLQGPFGLTDDKAEEAMTAVEPVFIALNQHLEQLVSASGVQPPEDVTLTLTAQQPARLASVQAASEESALRFIFQHDVPVRLREMLQFFKQPDSAASRQQLQSICQTLAQAGEQLDLPEWCELMESAEQAIRNSDNTYRTLAPILIKDIKHAQEQILAGHAPDVATSDELLDLLPPELDSFADEATADAELANLLGADNDDFDLFAVQPDQAPLAAADFELPELELPELEMEPASTADSDFDDFFGSSQPPEASSAGDLELNSFDSSFASAFGSDAESDVLDLADLAAGSLQVGPKVGSSELNTLADLFEGEDSDLSLDWQEEIMQGGSELELELDATSDFSDLLDSPIGTDLAVSGVEPNSAASADAATDWSSFLGNAAELETTSPEFDFSEFDQNFDHALSADLSEALQDDDLLTTSDLDADLFEDSTPLPPADNLQSLDDLFVLSEEQPEKQLQVAEPSASPEPAEFDPFGELNLDADLALDSLSEDSLPEDSLPEDLCLEPALFDAELGAETDLELGAADLFDQPLDAEPALEMADLELDTLASDADLELDDFNLDDFSDSALETAAIEPEVPAALDNLEENSAPLESDSLFETSPDLAELEASPEPELDNPFAFDLDAANLDSEPDLFSLEASGSEAFELSADTENLALEPLSLFDLATVEPAAEPAAELDDLALAADSPEFDPELEIAEPLPDPLEAAGESEPAFDLFQLEDEDPEDGLELDSLLDAELAGAADDPFGFDFDLDTAETDGAIDGVGVSTGDSTGAIPEATPDDWADNELFDLNDGSQLFGVEAAHSLQPESQPLEQEPLEPADLDFGSFDWGELDSGTAAADVSDLGFGELDATFGENESLSDLAKLDSSEFSHNSDDTAFAFELDDSSPNDSLNLSLDQPESWNVDVTSDVNASSDDGFDLLELGAAAGLGAAGLTLSNLSESNSDAAELADEPADELNFEDDFNLFEPELESTDSTNDDIAGDDIAGDDISADWFDNSLSNSLFDDLASDRASELSESVSIAGFSEADLSEGDLPEANLEANLTETTNDFDLDSFATTDFSEADLFGIDTGDLVETTNDFDLDSFAEVAPAEPAAASPDLASAHLDLLADDDLAQDIAEPAEFDDLAAMLAEDSSPITAIHEPDDDLGDDFSDLEALIGDVPDDLPDPLPAQPPAPAIVQPAAQPIQLAQAELVDDEFGDLEALLQDADQALGGVPARKSQTNTNRRPNRRSGINEQNMRVSVKHLDNLNNLVGEMVVNRNTLEQAEERLRQFLDNLLYQVQQLSDVGQRMRDLYERSLLESSLLSGRRGSSSFTAPSSSFGSASSQPNHATGASFDALEMDRFTGFHTLSQEMIELIVRVRESASDIDFVVEETDQVTRNFRQITTQLQEGLTRSRMVPFAQTADRLTRGVRDNALKYGKQAELLIEGRDTLIDKMIVELLYDPMTHLVNNAVAHGIETPEERIAAGKPPTGRITVRAFHQGNQTVISVSDDGAGINPEIVRAKALAKKLITPTQARDMTRLDTYDLLFHHGFSTVDRVDDLRGRGVGLDVVRNNLNEIRGTINIDSTIGKGTAFTIRLPLTLSISKALCCISNRARIAFPMDGVEDMIDVPRERVQLDDQERPCIQWRDELLPFQTLSDLLRYNRVLGRGSVYGGNQEEDMISLVILRSSGNFLALQVDQVLGEQEIVIKQLEGPVPKPLGVAGATVLGDGRIMPIADVLELIDLWEGRIRRESGTTSLWDMREAPPEQIEKAEPTVLIVDDSITVRELLSMTFNKVGYRVEQARDGQEAWEKLRSGLPCDLVFCDIEMPRMDGLELLSRIQKDPNLSHLPVAMLTSRGADRHRQMATQLGARGYFTKPYLEEVLLDAANRMLKGEMMVTSANTQ